MWKALLVASIALALAACTRAEKRQAETSARGRGPDRSTDPRCSATPRGARPVLPPRGEGAHRGRQFERRHALAAARWLSFPALLGEVRYGLVLTDTPLVDRDGNSKGTLIPEPREFTLLEAGRWVPGLGFSQVRTGCDQRGGEARSRDGSTRRRQH